MLQEEYDNEPVKLNKKQINLIFLCCGTLVLPIMGSDIRHYYDTQNWIALAITIGYTTSIFIIIRNALRVTFGIGVKKDKK